MNGAESILKTLVAAGVDTCFANPGTSEMHFVNAIGKEAGMRSVLGLFEGVCSGAADGYARMTRKPACTLLHLGPGLANATANIHNARRAHSPMVNLIGDHATYHLQYDAPLTSDLPGHAGLVSDYVRVSESADDLAQAGADAVQAALHGAGRVATFIAPANHAWERASEYVMPREPAGASGVRASTMCTMFSARSCSP